MLGGGRPAPEVVIELCTCGVPGTHERHDVEADWPLATAWAWLTRPVEPEADAVHEPAPEPARDPADEPADLRRVPWWDARSGSGRRRAVLPLVLLGELQAGVLARAVWEVVRGRSGFSL